MTDHDQSSMEASELQRNDVVSVEEISRALESSQDILAIAELKAEAAALSRDHLKRTIITTIVLVALAAYAGYLISRSEYAKHVLHVNIWYILLSGILGASVGCAELVSRYRDEPTQALRSAPALTYLTLNALVSVSVYGLLTHYAKTLVPTLANDPLMRSITAGFGAMAVLRSKFFTLRTEKGEDVGIGPDAAIAAFLSAADRGVDRARAKRRLDLVFKSTSRVSKVEYVKDFIKVSLLSFQNLTGREKDDINKRIDDIYKDDIKYRSPELKLQAMCYAVLIIVGEYNFNKLINNLVDFIKRREEEITNRKDLAKKTSVAFVDQLRQSRPASEEQEAEIQDQQISDISLKQTHPRSETLPHRKATPRSQSKRLSVPDAPPLPEGNGTAGSRSSNTAPETA